MTSTTPDTTITATLLFGDIDETKGAVRSETLTVPSPTTPEGLLDELTRANVTTSDIRSRAELQLPGDVSATSALTIVATLSGFAGRFLPTSVGDVELSPTRIAADVSDAGPKPDVIPNEIIVDQADSDDQIHYARRAIISADQNPESALRQLFRVAATRHRPGHERFPDVAHDPKAVLAGEADALSLEDMRRLGFQFRGEHRANGNIEVAPPQDPTDREQRLQHAASAPIDDVMRRLGSTTDETGERWHCPRPERHNNGDQNPSMRIVDGKTRCFRCDPEWVDSLRITLDTLKVSVDEAADWILSGRSR